jgi:hypothetical protein
MLSHVPHVEQRDTSYSTPLHVAASMRNKHITELLLRDHNADANARDRNGMSPLRKYSTPQCYLPAPSQAATHLRHVS